MTGSSAPGTPQDNRGVRRAAYRWRAAASAARKDLRDRLNHIEARLPDLRRLNQQRGDALAGALLKTLEREQAEILTKITAIDRQKRRVARQRSTEG